MSSFFKKGDALFGFLKSGRNKRSEIVFRPVWGRVLGLLGVLAITGWMTLALAVMLFVKHSRGFEGGKYRDLVLPVRWTDGGVVLGWDHYRVAWGEEFIERGLALIEAGEVQQGVRLVRVGHAKSPNNLDGRLVMAELYTASHRPDLAARVLRQGLPHAEGDLNFLRTTLRVLLANQDDDGIQEVAAEILPPTPVLTPYNQVAALASATAHFHRGNYERAEDLLAQYDLTTNPEGRILLVRIDWERGHHRAALDRLEAMANQSTEQEEIYILLSRYYRELGDHTKAHNYAVLRQVNNPMSSAPRIALLHAYHEAGNLAKVQRESDRLLREFGKEASALLGIGEFAAKTGDIALARRVLETLDRNGLPLDSGAILLAETLIEAGNFRDTITHLENHVRDDPEFAERHGALLSGLYAVAYSGLDNSDRGEMYLTQFLNARHLRAETHVLLSQRFIEQGRHNLARRVLAHAHVRDPLNQTALIELIRLDLEAGRAEDLVTNIEKLITMRKPPRALLEDSVARLSSDKFLFLPNRDNLLQSIHTLIKGAAADPSLTHS